MWSGPPEALRGRLGRAALGLFLVWALLWLGVHIVALAREIVEPLTGILVPLLFGFGIAYLLNPAVDRLERIGLPRGAGVLLLVVAAAGLVALLVVFALPALYHEISTLVRQLPGWVEAGRQRLGPWLLWLETQYPEAYANVSTRVAEALRGYDWTSLLRPLLAGLESAVSHIGRLLGAAVGVALVPVLAVYLLRDFPQVRAAAASLVPPRHLPWIRERLREVDGTLGGFVRGQLMVVCCLTVLYGTGLSLLGVPLALLIACLAGPANLVPFMGLVVGVVPSLLLTLLQYGPGQWWRLLAVAGVFAVSQFIEANLLTPNLVGNRVGLHPVGAIVALLLFAKWFGFVGLLVALPTTSVLLVFARHALARYRRSGFFRDGAPPGAGGAEPGGG